MRIINVRVTTSAGLTEFDVAINEQGELKPGGQLQAESAERERDEALAAGRDELERRQRAEVRVAELEAALDSVKSAVGDRLLGKGPLSEPYAHGVMRQINAALKGGCR